MQIILSGIGQLSLNDNTGGQESTGGLVKPSPGIWRSLGCSCVRVCVSERDRDTERGGYLAKGQTVTVHFVL